MGRCLIFRKQILCTPYANNINECDDDDNNHIHKCWLFTNSAQYHLFIKQLIDENMIVAMWLDNTHVLFTVAKQQKIK